MVTVVSTLVEAENTSVIEAAGRELTLWPGSWWPPTSRKFSVHSSESLSQSWKDKLGSVFLGTWAASVLPNMRQVSEACTRGIVLHFLLVTLGALEALYSTQRNMGISLGDTRTQGY